MANWELQGQLFGGLKETFATVDANFITPLNDIISLIDQFNSAVSNITSIINTLTGQSLPDLGRASLESLQSQVKQLLNDFVSSGVYFLPVVPTEKFVNDPFEAIDGGFSAFKTRVNASVTDIFDNQRPTFGSNSYTAGFVSVFASEDQQTILEGLNAFKTIFNFSSEVVLNISSVVNLDASPGNNSVVLTWEVDERGFTPTHFKIERKTVDSEFETLVGYHVNLGKNRYVDNTAVNDVLYEYKITPISTIYEGDSSTIKSTPLETEGSGNIDTTGKKTCAHLLCSLDNNRKCELNHINFTETEDNENGIKCFNGSIVCDKYLNKRCKYDSGTACTSTGFTVNKLNVFDTNGNLQTTANKDLYISKMCQNGKNGVVCDGFTELEVSRTGAPPNWESLSVKRFLPDQVSQVLDLLNGFIDSLFETTAQASDAMETFTDLLTDTTNSLKSILLEIREYLNQLNSLFNVSAPGMWTLAIEPGIGGTKRFLTEFNNALNSPPYVNSGYVTGFVLLFGGAEPVTVSSGYAIWQKLLGF